MPGDASSSSPTPDPPELAELGGHDGLLAQLEAARGLGFLGPGPVLPHLAHAVAFLRALEDVDGAVVDLGSGGGVPGLVLAVARPDLQLCLVDARAVRCRFLERAVAALGVEVDVVEGRAEDLGRTARRGTASAVVARSFGAPAVTAECGSPLLQVGGRLVVSEPPPPERPERWPEAGLRRLGLRRAGILRVGAGAVQVLEQAIACPGEYPRRAGVPAKRPLF
jgi:16S rRNA (guanine527-N7)-methyltransferase